MWLCCECCGVFTWHLVMCVTHSGISPKASTDWATVVYALMYSLAVFWTWHSYTETNRLFFFVFTSFLALFKLHLDHVVLILQLSLFNFIVFLGFLFFVCHSLDRPLFALSPQPTRPILTSYFVSLYWHHGSLYAGHSLLQPTFFSIELDLKLNIWHVLLILTKFSLIHIQCNLLILSNFAILPKIVNHLNLSKDLQVGVTTI